jgi:hypothetical protein
MPVTDKFDASKLPLIYGKNALRFDGKPENLAWYMNAIEEVILKTGATLDE